MEDRQNKRFERKPNFEMHTKLSRDGRYWIIKRVETWVLPRRYMDVIAHNHSVQKNKPEAKPVFEQPQAKGSGNVDSNGQGN